MSEHSTLWEVVQRLLDASRADGARLSGPQPSPRWRELRDSARDWAERVATSSEGVADRDQLRELDALVEEVQVGRAALPPIECAHAAAWGVDEGSWEVFTHQ